MHTNHRDGTKARQDFRSGYKGPWTAFKRCSNRKTRCRESAVLSELVRGVVEADSAIFPINFELVNPWSWD
jgi:hypothetical protein